jgi:hypothetical protein
MTVCITTDYLDQRSRYPVLDPRRTAGPGPYNYGYGFALDGIQVRVERRPGPSSCQMEVVLESDPGLNKKGILAWNFHANTFVDYVGNRAGDNTSMVIRKEGTPGHACGTGADTVVLGRWDLAPVGWQAQYYFPPQDFWDLWGGCKVTFMWITDQRGSGVWGPQTPQPTYPLVPYPDYTLLREDRQTFDHEVSLFHLVVGGAAFPLGSAELDSMGLASGSAIPFVPLPSAPADGTLVREWDSDQVYVTYGGAGFEIPDPDALYALGFDWSRVRVIPSGGTAQLRTMPIDGTLLREQKGTPRLEGPRHDFLLPGRGVDPGVNLVDNQLLRRVTSTAAMEENCLPWRHVRTVPEGALAHLTPGPDLGP